MNFENPNDSNFNPNDYDPYDPGRHPPYDPFEEAKFDLYPSADIIREEDPLTPLQTAHDVEMEIIPEETPAILPPPVTGVEIEAVRRENAIPPSPTVRGVEMAVEYVGGAAMTGLKSFLEARDKGESTRPVPRQEFEDSDGNKITDLADYDEPSNRRSSLAFDQGVNTLPYLEALNDAGLGITKDPFLVSFSITDGEKLISMLTSLPEQGASTALRSGVGAAVATSLGRVVVEHAPVMEKSGIFGNELRFVKPGQPPDGSKKFDDTFPPESAAQALLHARPLCDAMAHAGVYEPIITDLRNAHTAEVEGVLPYWAVAQAWDLYRPPTTDSRELHWTTWSHNDWEWVTDFLDQAITSAPDDSHFVRTLAATLGENITRMQTRNLQPTTLPPIPGRDPSYPIRTGFDARVYNDTLFRLQQRLWDLADGDQ